MLSSIAIIVYYSTKKDFTTSYQTEIICNTNYTHKITKEKVREKIKISTEFEKYPDYIDIGNKRIDGQMNSEMFIVLSYYNDSTKEYDNGDAYYAGKSFADVFQSIHLIKNFIIEEYNAKCY